MNITAIATSSAADLNIAASRYYAPFAVDCKFSFHHLRKELAVNDCENRTKE